MHFQSTRRGFNDHIVPNFLVFLFSVIYSWRYDDLGDLEHVTTRKVFKKANAGLAHTFQLINVDEFEVRLICFESNSS